MTPFSFFEIVLRFLALMCLINTLVVIVFRLETPKSLFNVLGKFLLIAGSVTAFCYLQETFIDWFVGNESERYVVLNRVIGIDHFWVFWLYIFCTGVVVQLLWVQRVRQNAWRLFIISIIVLASVWFIQNILIGLTLVNPN